MGGRQWSSASCRASFALLLLIAAASTWSTQVADAFLAPSARQVSAPWQVRSQTGGAVRMMADGEQGEKKGWPALRAFKTFLFYNRPRLFRRGNKESEPVASPSAASSSSGSLSSGVVLVTGATGGVGKRVVQLLRNKGLRVRALARNELKALAFLSGGQKPDPSSGLEVVVADIKDASTLKPALFKDVVAVVACTAAIVQPREGDSVDRSKYYQGIKYYEPEVVDAPKDVDFQGIVNTLEAVKKSSDLQGKKIFSTAAESIESWKVWGSLDDIVMGGVSDSKLELVPGAGEEGSGGARIGAVFSGKVSTAVGFSPGGFVSARTRNLEPALDLSGYKGIKLRVKGDGNRYKFILRDEMQWDGMSWSNTFDTQPGVWMDVFLPFDQLIPTMRTVTVPVSQRRKFQASTVYAFQVMLSKFEYDGGLNPNFREGDFSLTLSSIEAYRAQPDTPRFVYISSAGVTRPGRPGIVLEEEPPAVRMNDMLGGILTNKLNAENAIRGSGLPYTVIRPCALTEEPRGAEMIVDQGDVIKGKISRDDVAELAVAALLEPGAANKTFEVKSNVPFSQAVQLDETPRDYPSIFGKIKTDASA